MKRVLLTCHRHVVDHTVISLYEDRSVARTVVRLLEILCEHSELQVIPSDGYDFNRGLVQVFRPDGGRFEEQGWARPSADLWLVFSDGAMFDVRELDFARRRDFHHAQLCLHESAVERGDVGAMCNTAEAERRTLKAWLAEQNFDELHVIPTYLADEWRELTELRQRFGELVAKPSWGAQNLGVQLLDSEPAEQRFRALLEAAAPYIGIDDYCFQPRQHGVLKRFLFAGGRLAGAHCRTGQRPPWEWPDHRQGLALRDFADGSPNDVAQVYDASSPTFAAELAAASRLFRRAELGFGSVDFLGDRIHELNGAGTMFTTTGGDGQIIDRTPRLLEYIASLLG